MASDSETVVLVMIVSGILFLISLAIGIAFLRTLQVALQRCAPENRAVSPGQVWLLLIPLFNIVWQFILFARIAESLRREFAARQKVPISAQDDFGKGLGLAICCLGVASIIPIVGILTSIAGFICLIIYWTRIAEYSRILSAANLGAVGSPAQTQPEPSGGWPILLILIFGFGASYLQRIAVPFVYPSIQHELHFSSNDTAWIFTSFTYGLLVGYIFMTVVTSLAGTRWGTFISLVGASVAACAAGLASSFAGLIISRVLLGFFAGGLFPAAVQSIREWFPSRMRAFAIGLVIASSQLVGILSQIFIKQTSHWRLMLLISGVPTAIIAILCFIVWPRQTPREQSRGVSGAAILITGMAGVGLLLASPVTLFVSNWLPSISRLKLGLTLADMRLAAIVVAAAGVLGAILAGGIAWMMMSGGGKTSRTLAVLLTVFVAMLPLVAVTGYASSWSTVLIIMAVCSMAFQGWSTLIYATVADILPARGVAIGAAITALMVGVSGLFASVLFGEISGYLGNRMIAPVLAVLAALALLAVILPAWLMRREPRGNA